MGVDVTFPAYNSADILRHEYSSWDPCGSPLWYEGVRLQPGHQHDHQAVQHGDNRQSSRGEFYISNIGEYKSNCISGDWRCQKTNTRFEEFYYKYDFGDIQDYWLRVSEHISGYF